MPPRQCVTRFPVATCVGGAGRNLWLDLEQVFLHVYKAHYAFEGMFR